MGEFLYYLAIKPIWLLFEIIFRISYTLFSNPGISILSVSLVMNILVLPMYLRSDAMQAEERKKQKDMEHWVREIRRTFKGDERFMILSEYYRQNDYQPWYVLKSSLSLLLQVPFFIAAYDFLSNLTLLKGASFLLIPDLGSPDGLIPVGGLHINLLPVLMTAINLTSAAIYTKNGTKKEKVQTVVFALVFLVLLYGSPSGLVIYWTLNNVFSLCKNIVMDILAKKKKPEKTAEKEQPVPEKDRDTVRLWALSAVLLTVFTGLSIPLSLIEASPKDFAANLVYPDPVRYAFLAFAIAAGIFILWGAVIFFLSKQKTRKIIGLAAFCASVIFIINHMVFSGQFGIISYTLIYDKDPYYGYVSEILNALFVILMIFVLIIFYKNRKKLVFSILSILIVCETIFSIYNIVSIEKTLGATLASSRVDKHAVEKADINNKFLKLSSKGKNVIVIMLDRSIGAYIPYIFQEKPELEQSFSGFTFYPNTVSTGTNTINASAALFGGYEYALDESNKRDDVLIKDKQNEALKLMPTLFAKEGYHSTVCDLPYADLEFDFRTGKRVFDDVENCDAYCASNGEYNDYLTEKERACIELEQQKRNFFFYSLFRSVPLFAQEAVYDQGNYLSITSNNIRYHFITCISFLRLMPQLTQIVDDGNSKGELIMIQNEAPHEIVSLNPPDYEPDSSVRMVKPENRTLPNGQVMDLSNKFRSDHYDVDMASIMKLAGWMDCLKELGVYDNTRIIITSDHGFELGQFQDILFDDIAMDVESVNPVLLVKDYDADFEGVKTDDTFMCNADVPTIAMKDIIKDPVNPFMGNPINSDRKNEGPIVLMNTKIDVDAEKDTVYDNEVVSWYSVHDNIFDRADWERLRVGVDMEE
ncbi:MAG: YidC/Oxa1 family membrane protein insertase [Lachnospiraceae bacterium]|nr:YidC/Oxa1 family membrane protein insertase [Lachnospiraceae bacterium]